MTKSSALQVMGGTLAVVCFVAEAKPPAEALPEAHLESRSSDPTRGPGIYGKYWWANRFLSRREMIAKLRGGEVDLVLLGDSICHFWEWRHPDSWAKLVAGRKVLNLGYGGDITRHVLWRIDHGELDGYTARTVVLMIGTNNNSSDWSNPTNVAAGVEAIVERIRQHQPKAKLVLHPILPRGASASSADHAVPRKRNDVTNALLKDFAARDGKIVWIDFNDQFLDGTGWVPKSLMADEIHPTDRGYDIWMEALRKAGVLVPIENEVFVRSTADKSLQPARFFVPESAKGKRVPLLVALHAWGCGHEGGLPWEWAKAACAKRGWALVYPHFRGSNDKPAACGSDLAVQDVVDAVAYAKREASVDEDRIYVCGGSGGGHAALLLAGRHPEIWAGVFAAAPVSDLSRFFEESVCRHGEQWRDLLDVCGGTPWERRDEYARRSPVTWLARAKAARLPVEIHAGWLDGRGPGSVPVGQALRAFNALADAADAFSEEDIAALSANEGVAKGRALRRTSGNVRCTFFEGGPEASFSAGIDWLARQRRGRHF